MSGRPAACCPLCSRDNGCAAARGEPACWCGSVRAAPGALVGSGDGAGAPACLCADCLAGGTPSPCTGVCELDRATGTCRGCSRTVREIEEWPSGGLEERRAVLRRLQSRERAPGPR